MSADFTPNKEDIKILPPFKMQVLTNFPYIEADFDALTNYQLLCKIVEYLNMVIHNENEVTEEVTGLYNAYVALQNYVNNYFNNLDVQEEINNKLDQMASDGSLTNLIKNYVDPIYQSYENTINNTITEQNEEIERLGNLVTSATSGAPLVASSTAGMTDTTRVYVNTTDGKWYYYDGDSWEIGGTYQAVRLADNSVSYLMLDSKLQAQVKPLTLSTSTYTLTGSYYDGSVGNTISTASYVNGRGGVLEVNPHDLISIPFAEINVNFGLIYPLFITDNSDVILARYSWDDFFIDSSAHYKPKQNYVIEIPDGGYKVYFNNNMTSEKGLWYPYKITSYSYLDERVTNQLTETTPINASSTLANTAYNLLSWNTSLNNYKTVIYPVNALDKINIQCRVAADGQFCGGIYVDNDGKPCGWNTPQGDSTIGNQDINNDYIVPAGAKYLYLCVPTDTAPEVSKYIFSEEQITEMKKLKLTYESGTLKVTNNSNGNYITMAHIGGNSLFMISSYKVGDTIKSFTTDMTPAPYIVNAVNNANGDRDFTGFTGGAHQWNNTESGSTATAEELSLLIYADDVLVSNGTYYCDNVKIIETNRVQANNTCLEAGGGRNVIEEKIIFNFDGTNLKVKNFITPLEDIIFKTYYGIQIALFNNSDYKVLSDKVYNTSTQANVSKKPDSIIANGIVCSKMESSGLGDYRYNNAEKVNISSGKAYYVPVKGGDYPISSGDIQYIEGEYIFDLYQN